MNATAPALPTGQLTFLFTDIEGSTRLLQSLGGRYRDALERHREILRGVFNEHDGREVSTHGDSFFVVFTDASAALVAAASVQRGLAAEPWPHEPVRVRIGLHSGSAVVSDQTYVGLDVHRAARIEAAANGGQVLLSADTAAQVQLDRLADVELVDLGAHRLKDLSRPEHLYQLNVTGLPPASLPPRDVQPAVDNLPVELTSFVGRERELADADRLLAGGRLLTLVGPGGAGKSRLALALAARVGDRFSDGVYFVPLASLTDPDLVAFEIAGALNLLESRRTTDSVAERLHEYLRDREALLVIDNFEQVLPARTLIGDLLAGSRRLKMIVTSRALLRLAGEHSYVVPPLSVPDPAKMPSLDDLGKFEAVALFVQRAQAVRADFQLSDDNAAAIVEICRRLDGLPLAVELAASRVRVLPPRAILERLGDRLPTLSSDDPDLPARQQALSSTIAWSHDLLDPAERRLFARLGVFAGGAGLDAIDAVAGSAAEPLGMDTLDGLTSLADKSLLNAAEDDVGEPRFGMLRTIREFAVNRLAESGEDDEVRDRHLKVFLDLAEAAEPHLLRSGRRAWLDTLERELDNLRAALDRALALQRVPEALRMVAALWRLWQMRGRLEEGQERIGAALRLPDLVSHPRELCRALEAAGGIAHWIGDMQASRDHYEARLRVAQQIGDPSLVADAMFDLSYAYVPMRDWPDDQPQRAVELLAEADLLYESLGDHVGQGKVRHARAIQRMFRGDPAAALVQAKEALRLLGAQEDHFVAWVRAAVAVSGAQLGHQVEAREQARQALISFAAARDLTGISALLDQAAVLAATDGDLERAAMLDGAATELTATSGAEINARSKQFPGALESGADVSPESIAAAWVAGRAMTLEEVVDFALHGLGPRD